MDTILPTKPASYGTIIRHSLKLYRVSFLNTLLIAIILAISTFIPRLLSYAIGQDIFLNLPPLSPYRIWLIIINLCSLLFFIALLWHINCALHQIREPLEQDIAIGIKKLFSIFIATLIQFSIIFGVAMIIYGVQILFTQYHTLFIQHSMGMIATLATFSLLMFLIIYISTLFVFLIPLIAIENKGVISALQNSILLVWNHWWRVFSVQITPWIFYILLLSVLKFELNINLHIYFFDETSHTLWPTILHIAIFTLFAPWVASTLLIQLNDLELRKKKVKKK